MFVSYAAAGSVVALPGAQQTAADAAQSAIALVIVAVLNSAVLAYLILRSRWAGWPLMAAIFVLLYGTTTLMAQMETAIFVTTLPPGTVPRLFLFGALVAAPIAVLSVIIFGKRRPRAGEMAPNDRLRMPEHEWAWRLAVISVAYLVLYFGFGYFIAWQNPAVREYYGGVDPGSVGAQLASVWRRTPWLYPVQIGRALLWVLLALPVIKMMKGSRLEAALAVGLAFCVLMNSQLLLPNAYMPDEVRMTHLIETASSNFLFGLLVGWLLADAQPVTRTTGA
jgi:hypothetical protein